MGPGLLAVAGIIMMWMGYTVLSTWFEAKRYAHFKLPRPANWLLGNLLEMDGTDCFDYIKKCMAVSPKVYANWMANSMMVSLVHPDTLKCVMSRGTAKSWNYRFMKIFLGEKSMLVDHGPLWHRTRRVLTPIFYKDMLRGYLKGYQESTQTLIDKIAEPTIIDCHETFALLTLDLTLQAGFGHRSNCQTEDSMMPEYFAKMNARMWNRTKNPLLWSDFVYENFCGDGTRVLKDVENIHAFCSGLLAKRREDIQNGLQVGMTDDGRPADFMQHLLVGGETRDMPDDEIISTITGLIFASFDTGCVALSWIAYALGKYPDWQLKCRDEVLTVLDGETELNYDMLAQLEVCTMFIKECLRMWPPVPLLGRVNPEDVELPESQTLPKNSWIEIGVWGTHHNPSVWPDPERFDPERFHPDKHVEPYSFLAFSAGPRNCLGQNFAMNELRCVMAMLLCSFDFAPDVTLPEPKLVAEIMLLTKDGLRVQMIPRATERT